MTDTADEADWEEDSTFESDESESEDDVSLTRSIRWLCQEGQLRLARQRFERLSADSSTQRQQQLKQEVFSCVDRNYALTEILMGGTSDSNAHALASTLLIYAKDFPIEAQKMLLTKNSSHGRTPLHWAAWGNAALDIIHKLVRLCPEAMLLEDKKMHGQRTPQEIMHYYNRSSISKLEYLERAGKNWIQHRLRLAVYEAAFYHFAKLQLTPFDKKDKKVAQVKPRPWFLISVLGFLLQREMKPLVGTILSFLGHGAKFQRKGRRSRKRKRRHEL